MSPMLGTDAHAGPIRRAGRPTVLPMIDHEDRKAQRLSERPLLRAYRYAPRPALPLPGRDSRRSSASRILVVVSSTVKELRTASTRQRAALLTGARSGVPRTISGVSRVGDLSGPVFHDVGDRATVAGYSGRYGPGDRTIPAKVRRSAPGAGGTRPPAARTCAQAPPRDARKDSGELSLLVPAGRAVVLYGRKGVL